MLEENPCRRLSLHRAQGSGRVGSPNDRDHWRATADEAKIHHIRRVRRPICISLRLEISSQTEAKGNDRFLARFGYHSGSYECCSPFHARFLLGWFSPLKMEVIRSSETSFHIRTTRWYIPEVGNTDIYRRFKHRVSGNDETGNMKLLIIYWAQTAESFNLVYF
jgi:hypothetical protein